MAPVACISSISDTLGDTGVYRHTTKQRQKKHARKDGKIFINIQHTCLKCYKKTEEDKAVARQSKPAAGTYLTLVKTQHLYDIA